jgi:large subunit ribosomal protein L28
VLSGNTVPHSMHKTRRKWYPNEQAKSLYSELLGCMVKVKLTSRVLRSIDKVRFSSFVPF